MGHIQDMSMKELAAEISQLQQIVEDNKEELAKLEEELEERVVPVLSDGLAGGVGTAHGDFDGVSVHMEVRKNVKWDQDELKAVASRMDADLRDQLVSVKMNVTETAYKKAGAEVQAYLNQARVVVPGKPKIRFEVLS